MARSVSNAKLISAFVVDRISLLGSRRGYAAAASQGAVSSSLRGGGAAAMSGMMLKKGGDDTNKTTPWVPDPVTGCYRPEKRANEIDAVELREMLLKHKN